MHAHNTGNGSAEKGDQPAGVDAQADAMEDTVDRLSLVSQRRDQRQNKMESHPGQRGDAGNVVPFGSLAVSQGEQVHLMRPQIVAQQADTENNQVLPMQSLLSPAEYGPRVENQGQIHPDYRLYQHLHILLLPK